MRRFTLLLTVVAVASLACRDDATAPGVDTAPGLSERHQGALEGRIRVQWGDPQAGKGPWRLRYQLTDDQGATTELVL